MEEQEEGRQYKSKERKNINRKSDTTDSDFSEKLLWQNCPDC